MLYILAIIETAFTTNSGIGPKMFYNEKWRIFGECCETWNGKECGTSIDLALCQPFNKQRE